MPPDEVENAEIAILNLLQHSVISTGEKTRLKLLLFPKTCPPFNRIRERTSLK